jgi:hypothetical protein
MNAMELLHAVLSQVFPGAETTLSTPLHEDGFWSLDFRLPDYYLSIDWRESDGFSLTSDSEHGYGEGPDEVYPDFSAALLRIIQLVQNRLETVPPHRVRIRELRQ